MKRSKDSPGDIRKFFCVRPSIAQSQKNEDVDTAGDEKSEGNPDRPNRQSDSNPQLTQAPETIPISVSSLTKSSYFVVIVVVVSIVVYVVAVVDVIVHVIGVVIIDVVVS